MTTIYDISEQFEVPKLDFRSIKEYQNKFDKLRQDVSNWCKEQNPNDEYAGETIKFPVADGYAEYMVLSVNPPELIFIPYMDEYFFQYDYLLGTDEIIEKVQQTRALNKIFS